MSSSLNSANDASSGRNSDTEVSKVSSRIPVEGLRNRWYYEPFHGLNHDTAERGGLVRREACLYRHLQRVEQQLLYDGLLIGGVEAATCRVRNECWFGVLRE